MAKNGKNDSSEAKPVTIVDRRLLGILAALIPTLFIALGAFVWRINDRVTTLEGKIKVTETRTLDRYTKEDAREDHRRVDKWVDEMQKQIYELSAQVNQLEGLHEGHKKPG